MISPRYISTPKPQLVSFFVCLLCGIALSAAARASTIHPKLVEADVTDLDLIHEISKFRSGAGHDFTYFKQDTLPPVSDEALALAMAVINGIDNFFATDTSEPESSMKHYYSPYAVDKGERGDNVTIPVYSPFGGTITRVTEEVREADDSIVNKRVEITSVEDPNYTAVLFHLNLDDTYPQIFNDYPDIVEIWSHQPDDPDYTTREVAAGDLLGYADMRLSNDFDVAVLFNDSTDDKWISIFELMPDALLAVYQARGVGLADTFITKGYRELHDVAWGQRNDDDWMTLTAIPEPDLLPLLALGGLAALRRRQGGLDNAIQDELPPPAS